MGTNLLNVRNLNLKQEFKREQCDMRSRHENPSVENFYSSLSPLLAGSIWMFDVNVYSG